MANVLMSRFQKRCKDCADYIPAPNGMMIGMCQVDGNSHRPDAVCRLPQPKEDKVCMACNTWYQFDGSQFGWCDRDGRQFPAMHPCGGYFDKEENDG